MHSGRLDQCPACLPAFLFPLHCKKVPRHLMVTCFCPFDDLTRFGTLGLCLFVTYIVCVRPMCAGGGGGGAVLLSAVGACLQDRAGPQLQWSLRSSPVAPQPLSSEQSML